MLNRLYDDRKLSEGYPEMERLGVEYHSTHHEPVPYVVPSIVQTVRRLIDLPQGTRMLVVGCGPRPHTIRELRELGFDAVGLEPVPGLRDAACEFLADPGAVRLGAWEALPFEDASLRVVIATSVLEHVDSPEQSLAESCRVLAPGGVLFVYTSNRWKFSLLGRNWEYRVPFFNWFPAIVKESYVFQHLHYDPTLANYNPRPAVHWFTYPELCRLGRQAGFGQFYSLLDLVDEDNPLITGRPLRRFLLEKVRYRPWLRALALTQSGGSILMLKRPE